jgi:hypothetical protein
VKRLCQSSRQGIGELKSELVLVAKLHHRNLVKLLGVCLQEHEKILVYDYMPNKSLDNILFGNWFPEQYYRFINTIVSHQNLDMKLIY